MKKNIKWAAAALAFILFIAGAYLLYDKLSSSYDAVKETTNSAGGSRQQNEKDENSGRPEAPDFTVTDYAGRAVKLSDMRGKPTVINFWASWCHFCKTEMPDFEKIYRQYGDKINFMMINATDGRGETVDTAKSFIESGGYTFPVYFDTAYEAVSVFGVRGFPMTFFIDENGRAVNAISGAANYSRLEKTIKQLLGEAE